MMTIPELRADCARCEALCCVALSFEASAQFALDKAAGVPCPLLSADHACRIHGARYDCLGAGQVVVQQVFAGRSWRREPALRRAMLAAFTVVRQIHELMELLVTARARLALSAAQGRRVEALLARLAPEAGWTPAGLEAVDVEAERRAVRGFLRGLGGGARIAAVREAAGGGVDADSASAPYPPLSGVFGRRKVHRIFADPPHPA